MPNINLPPGPMPKPTTARCVTVGSACTNTQQCLQVAELCPLQGGDPIDKEGLECYKGYCRLFNRVPPGQRCDCFVGCQRYDPVGDYSCVNNLCAAVPAAACGEPPNQFGCAAPGIKDGGGKCFCASNNHGCEVEGCNNPNEDCCPNGLGCRRSCSG